MAKIFLICPVRNAGSDVSDSIAAYVAGCEASGHSVHWPARDTKQDGDPIGIRICRDNREAMFAADEVHVWYDPDSKGSCFDIGMLIAAVGLSENEVPVYIANLSHDLVARLPASPQLTALCALASETIDPELFYQLRLRLHEGDRMFECSSDRHEDLAHDVVAMSFDATDTSDLIALGMLFGTMSMAPYQLMPKNEVTRTPEKSFNNLFLWLVEHTKDGPKTV
jgi:hypothetical protein